MTTTSQQVQACSQVTGYQPASFDTDGGYLSLHGTPYLAMDREVTASELREGWWLMGEANGLYVYQLISYV